MKAIVQQRYGSPADLVTAVDSAGKLDMLRSLGADEVIDYAREDSTRRGVATISDRLPDIELADTLPDGWRSRREQQ